MLSELLQHQIISAMRRSLGGDSTTFKITQIESASWDDCLTRASNCQLTERKMGYKIQVEGQGETWTYYIANDGNIQLDGPASISLLVRQALIKNLGYASNTTLNILATRPLSLIQSFDANFLAQPRHASPITHWQILIDQQPHPITIDLQGEISQPDGLKSFLPPDLAGLDPMFAEAILQDVRDRYLGTLPANLIIESIKETPWADNWAANVGEPAPNPGPTKLQTGAYCIATTSGWQVVIRSGPIRWVYYLQSFSRADWTQQLKFTTVASLVSPDGPQSLPKAIADAVIQAVAQREQQSHDNYHLYWVESRFFDACLNPSTQLNAVDYDDFLDVVFDPVNPALCCRQGLQSGWEIQVMGPGKTGNSRIFNYCANLTGSEIRFISAYNWMIAYP